MRKLCLKLILSCFIILSLSVASAQDVVISQVYGGGGNSGATYTNDFIELFNRGNTPVSLLGWSVQYASSAGTSWSKTDLTNVVLAPGQYYLVQEAQGSGGTTPLPTPDASGSIAMSGTSGKIALVNSTTLLTGTCPTVIDFVGYGTANCFEGTGPTNTLSNTTAAIRAGNGCTDNNNNAGDFSTGAPTPRNTSSAISVCGAPVTSVSVAAGNDAAEGGASGTFTVTLSSPAPAGGVTVTYTLTGTATPGTDYTDAGAGTITIAEADLSGTITLAPVNDPDFEGTETISITLNTATAPYTINTATADIDLLDNDAPPTVSVTAGISAAEPGTDGTFTVTLSTPAPAGGITVTYTLGGTANAGIDYTDPLAGSITIPETLSAGTITLDVTDDPDAEPVETITITLNTVTAPYNILSGNAVINLTSDDFAPISLTAGNVYTQDFNTLANTGTANSLSIPGWQMNETGGGARDNELYAADNGASNTGDTYSYGSTTTSDRALGSLLSGSLVSSYGAMFVNNTGAAVTSLKISYTGEQWRLGTINRTDKLDFQYSTDAGSITSGTWLNFDQLDFTSPVTTTLGAKDGNAASNRTFTTYTIHGLNIPVGASIFIRWNDTDASGADDGLAVDDLSVEANPIDNNGPVITSFSPLNNAVNVPLGSSATITFDEDLQPGTGNIYIKRTSDNVTVQTLNVNSAAVTLAVNKVSFTINGVTFGTGYYVEIDEGAFQDVLNNSFTGISGNSTWSFTTEPPPPPGIVGHTYNFDVCSTNFPDGFTQFSTVGSVLWGCTTFGRDASDPAGLASLPNGVQINGFAGGTNVPNVDWFISPPYDLTGTTFPLLSFWSRVAFNGLPLQLKVSTDYTGGDPSAASWTDINGKFPGQTSNVWTLSENINLSAFKQSNVHFAFVYTSSEDDGARWTLDDITVINSAVPPPPSLTISTTDIQYTFVPAGSTADRTFIVTGNDLTDAVTLTATGAFTLSRDGSVFTPGLSYTIAEANNIPLTVYVRFAPPQNNQNFTGAISVNSGSLAETINLSGSSIDPTTTLEVVNWNIEWFGSTAEGPSNDAQQEQNVRTILQNIGADVYAVTEIVSETSLSNVVSQMPGYAYVISNYGSHTNTSANPPSALAQAQKLAFIYKTSVLSNVSTMPLLSQGINSPADLINPAYNYYASGRFPYMMNADVTLNCVTRNVKFVLVHAKANTSPTATSYDRRKRGADTLHYTLQQDYANDNVIILGDFNDDLDVTITAGINPPVTSYSSFINDPANFTAVTLPLSLAGKKSTVAYNDVIDHVMISNEMNAYYMTATANILTDVTSLVSNYGSSTSDHYPVFSRYVFENETAPQITSCPVAGPFCNNSDNTYTIPLFSATDDCDAVIYSYVITGATQRAGSTNNASGIFNSGTSYIEWTASDEWGNSVSCSTTVVVGNALSVAIPDAFALPSGVLANTVYYGYQPASSLTLTTTVNGGAPGYTYNWTGGSTASAITVNPISTTTYTVTVTDANQCQGTASKTVNVMDIREGNKGKKVVICHKPDGPNQSKIVAIEAVPAHLAHGDMLGSCVCPDQEYSKTVPAVEEKEVPAETIIFAFPNPSSGEFTLQIGTVNADEKVSLRITDIQGRVIEQQQSLRPGQSLKFGASYRPGTYFAEINTGSNKKVLKLVKL